MRTAHVAATTRPIAVLAEDEPLIRFEAAMLLDELGFEVLEAHCASAALEHLEANGGAALLYTDVDMPGRIDGFDLAHSVARRWPDTAIIVCSGCMPKVAACLPRSARFLGKPCAGEEVREALVKLRLHS